MSGKDERGERYIPTNGASNRHIWNRMLSDMAAAIKVREHIKSVVWIIFSVSFIYVIVNIAYNAFFTLPTFWAGSVIIPTGGFVLLVWALLGYNLRNTDECRRLGDGLVGSAVIIALVCGILYAYTILPHILIVETLQGSLNFWIVISGLVVLSIIVTIGILVETEPNSNALELEIGPVLRNEELRPALLAKDRKLREVYNLYLNEHGQWR